MGRTEVTGKQIRDGSVELDVDVTGVLPVANGGSGSDTLPLNNVLLGNGTGALQTVAPGTSGNVLTSDGSTWTSAPAADPSSKQSISEKGQPDGYASLDGDGKVPTSQLPLFGAVDSVNGQTGVVVVTASDVGLGNVDNTADADKPVSMAMLSALDGKQDIAEKGEPNGYPDLDGDGKIPTAQLPDGMVVDGVQVMGDTFQLYSGDNPIGSPISLAIAFLDGGTPSDVTVGTVDGGLL